MKNKFDKFQIRVVKSSSNVERQTMLQMTRNGHQWQSIAWQDIGEARALRDALISYCFEQAIESAGARK